MSRLPDILRRIVDQRRATIRRTRASIRAHLDATEAVRPGTEDRSRWFLDRLARRRGSAIIAEVKLGSPSLGGLKPGVSPEGLAEIYARNGAAALSVVTEPDFFFGSYALLSRCQQVAGLPALAKDFLVDPIQVELASHAGASACLLIAALHSASELVEFAERIEEAGMVPVVECHDEVDVAKLGDRQWPVVGVNNRNLRTFEVDLEHSRRLVSTLPANALKVAESGLSSRHEIESLAAAGFDAFLVGETLLVSDEPGTSLRALAGEPCA